MTTATDLGIDRISVLETRPGDVIVLHSAEMLSMTMADRLREHMTLMVPEGVKVLVLDRGMSIHVLRGEASSSCPTTEIEGAAA